MNLMQAEYFSVDNAEEAFRRVGILSKVKNNKGVEFYNYACAFDIETSSFIVHSNGQEHKRGIMYIWTLALGENIIIQGRRWEQFIELCVKISNWYETNEKCRFVIYVHNLSYEFQFFHKYFTWKEVFSLKKRAPIRALTYDGIEFRCSYYLSGYSLEKLANNLVNHDIKKLVGDLDYRKIRHSETPILIDENQYCVNDVLIVTSYINEYIERVGDISLIPMTKTGEVRNYTRNQVFMVGVRRKRTMIYIVNTEV